MWPHAFMTTLMRCGFGPASLHGTTESCFQLCGSDTMSTEAVTKGRLAMHWVWGRHGVAAKAAPHTASHIAACSEGLVESQLPIHVHPGRQQELPSTQVPTPTGVSWLQSHGPAVVWPGPSYHGHLESEPANGTCSLFFCCFL